MRFALVVPNWAPFDQNLMIRLALEAEELGFERCFFTDHLMNPYAKSEGLEESTVEVWSLISYIAAKTSRIRLGTAVTPMSVRPPALLAKQVATIDNLSGGRIDLGVGTGWARGSFDAIDAEFATQESRAARLVEGLDLIIKLWTEDSVDFRGEYYAAKGAVIAPKPVQKPYPPIWVGGWRPYMLELTAQRGDGWIPWNRPVDVYSEFLNEIRRQATALGRADRITYGTAVLVLPDRLRDERMAMIHGDPPNITVSTIESSVEAYEEAGAELFVVFPFPPEDALETVRQFARQLL
jgi:probable F420-dependent oxidoreductase